jgi:EmrB/QacA subfamily drug resistance transporter
MINLDANVVAVSLPAISRSFRADFAATEWVVSAYTLTFGCLVLPAGTLADRYGRKRILLLGLGVFTAASFLCGVAPSAAVLIGVRALQGVGAALQLSASLAILSSVFTENERARAFAFWGALVGIAIMLGPVAGGIIIQASGWELTFDINVLVGASSIMLTAFTVSESSDPNAERVDLLGSALFISGVFFLILAIISGNARGWSSLPVLLAFGCAGALLAGFFLAEARQRQPMIDLHLFDQPTFLGANIAALAFAATVLTMLIYLPIYFQSGLGYSPQQAGLLMLPLSILLFVVPWFVVVYLMDRLSGRALLTIGLLLVVVGMVALAVAAPRFNYGTLVGGLLVVGVGAGVLNSEVVKVGMTVVPSEHAGMASGVSGTVRFTGIVIGFAILGAVLAERIKTVLAQGLDALGPVMGGAAPDPTALARRVIAGDLSGTVPGAPEAAHPLLHALALESFGEGFRLILLAAAAFAALSAVLTWVLVRREDTAPVAHKPEPAHLNPSSRWIEGQIPALAVRGEKHERLSGQ